MGEKFADRRILAAIGEPFGDRLRVRDSLRGRAKHDAILCFFEENRSALH